MNILYIPDPDTQEVLDVLPDLTKWANEITAYATEAAIHHGKEWNGFKVVEGRSNRKYHEQLGKYSTGDVVTVTAMRKGAEGYAEMTFDVTMGEV